VTLVAAININETSYVDAMLKIQMWAQAAESRYVCAANVHMVMETWDKPDFREIVNTADIVTPDGMPLVWVLRLKGHKDQQRVYGPTLFLHVLEIAASENIPVGFYGGEPSTLELLIKRMQARYPGLNVAYACSPPFRELSRDEDLEITSDIKKSGARILFVGLGCPKQERWMAAHRGQIPAVMIGVGAAFDFHAGVKRQAPGWVQKMGLEWLFRFFQEPRRLWRRYLVQNPRFVLLALAELLGILKISQDQEGKDA
jgi:N-acetylglucosaminyldiphosphoundecaprenol N-acetyl-beta-D-mannosaminyltransferase